MASDAHVLGGGLRGSLEDALCRARIYAPARNAYQRALNRPYYAARRRDRRFFEALVPRGGLVFDVGANHGRLSETFAEIGARVVAVEPNPVLAARVEARYGPAGVRVESVALGAEPGTAVLRLGRDTGHSSLSEDWQAIAGPDRWAGSVRVPVTTLDALIARYGVPDFVKIDVEGFEPEVLAGLQTPVPALSIEFLCASPDTTRRSVERIAALGAYEFNLALGENRAFARRDWTDAPGIVCELAAVAERTPDAYGDVYARRRAS